MHAGQVLRCEDLLADYGTLSRNEIHHAVGEACFLVDLHQVVVREDGRGGRFPHGHVAHQHRRHIEVRCDGGEVERRQREDEAFERAVLHRIDLALRALGLEAVDLGGKVRIVAQEVDQLAGGVDLGLVEVLALAEHRGSVHQRAVLRGNELRGLHQDGGAHRPVGHRPLLVGFHRGVDGHPHFLRAGLVVGGQHVMVVVRHHYLAGIAGADFLPADDQRNLDFDAALAFEFFFEGLAFGGSFQIGLDRLVGRIRECVDRVSHFSMFCLIVSQSSKLRKIFTNFASVPSKS